MMLNDISYEFSFCCQTISQNKCILFRKSVGFIFPQTGMFSNVSGSADFEELRLLSGSKEAVL